MGIEFHNTGYGRKFFDHQLPEVMKSLAAIAAQLQRRNDLEESNRPCEPSEEEYIPGLADVMQKLAPAPVVITGRQKDPTPRTADGKYWLGKDVNVINHWSPSGYNHHEAIITAVDIRVALPGGGTALGVEVIYRANEHEPAVGFGKVPYDDLR